MHILGFSSESSWFITSIVNTLFGQPGVRQPEYIGDGKVHWENGILIDITLEVTDEDLGYDAREDTKSLRHYYFAFCGNVNVFMARRDKGRGNGLKNISEIGPDDWKNLSNHDSCWSDGVRQEMNKIRAQMCDEVNPDPKVLLTTTCDVGFAGRLWQIVEITTGRDPERDAYWRKLVEMKFK